MAVQLAPFDVLQHARLWKPSKRLHERSLRDDRSNVASPSSTKAQAIQLKLSVSQINVQFCYDKQIDVFIVEYLDSSSNHKFTVNT